MNNETTLHSHRQPDTTRVAKATMKAVIQRTYGPPECLRLEEIERPRPRAGEVLVRVHAAAANAGDWHLMRADPFLIRLHHSRQRSPFQQFI